MKDNDLLYQVAPLLRVPHIGDVHAKMLVEIYGSAQNIFHAPKKELEKIEGIGPARARAIRHFNLFAECEREIAFLDKYGIKALFVTSKEYPNGYCIAMMAPPSFITRETPTSMPTGSYR
ncbi:MAG: helix-hairpin-helix domain-containing protein [Ferruginibacter sp.]